MMRTACTEQAQIIQTPLYISDVEFKWLKIGLHNKKIYRTFFLNPAFRTDVPIVHQTAVDGKSLSDWPKSEFNSVLGWTVPSLCSSKPASSLTMGETSVFTVLAFALAGGMACIKNLRSRDPDILVQLEKSIWILIVTELWWACL